MIFMGIRVLDASYTPRWISFHFCRTPVLGQGPGVDFTFAWDHNDNNDKNNPHLNFLKGTVLLDKEQGVGIRDNGQESRGKGQESRGKGKG